MYIAREAIPASGNYHDGISFLLSDDKRKMGVETAKNKMSEAISVIRSMPGYEDKTDEEISKILVEKIEERKRR